METVEFKGKIVYGSEILLSSVSGYYILERQGGFSKWYGELTIESGESPFLFHGRLITEDGKQGNVFATSLASGNSAIQFQGTGPIE